MMKTYWMIGKEGFTFRIEKEVCVYIPKKKKKPPPAVVMENPTAIVDADTTTQVNDSLTPGPGNPLSVMVNSLEVISFHPPPVEALRDERSLGNGYVTS